MITKQTLFTLLITYFLCAACRDNKQNIEQTEQAAPVITVKTPVFNADSAYAFIEKQVSFGPRVPNTQAHRQTGDYLVNTLKKYGAQVSTQEFVAEAYNGNKLQSRNIIAAFFPQETKRILLAAHWDSRHIADKDSTNPSQPIDGANDGGSGVGVLLEIARILQQDTTGPNVGIDIIFFDSEDYGEPNNLKQGDYPNRKPNQIYWCLGSQYWAKNKHIPNYSAYYGILLDMVGAKGVRFAKEGHSMNFAGSVVTRIWDIAHALGYTTFFTNQNMGGITDDHYFVNRDAKIPMIDIIEYDPAGIDEFGAYHHTHQDNMQIIDKTTLKAVGQTVLQALYEEGQPAS